MEGENEFEDSLIVNLRVRYKAQNLKIKIEIYFTKYF